MIKKHNIFFISTILSIGLFASVPSFAKQNINLNTASEWAKPEISKAYNYNLLTNKVTNNYTSYITREEFTELTIKLYRSLSGKELPNVNSNPFSDTQNPSVIVANELGIVNGIGHGLFAPNNTATREEIVVMLYRTLKAARPNSNVESEILYIFKDQNTISKWAVNEVIYLCKTGVVNGNEDKMFVPGAYTSKEEAIAFLQRMYENFGGRYIESNDLPSRSGSNSYVAGQLQTLLSQEMEKPYQWGATGPNSYDCSGLVYSVYGKLGISLPRVSRDQAKAGVYVSKDNLQYGDLVFFAADGKTVNHVGIYVGDGKFVHAPSTGDVVKTSSLSSAYYSRTYYTARRVIR